MALTALGLAPQLNLNGGQQGQGLGLGLPVDRDGLGLGEWRIRRASEQEASLDHLVTRSNKNFAEKWAAVYHGKATPESIYDRLISHQFGERKPIKGGKNQDAFGNMEAAVEVFKGDTIKAPGIKEGAEEWTGEEIKEILTRIGSVETGFNPEQKKQWGGGPARSYWQVEPKTALNLLNDESKVLFQKKFEDRFRDKVISTKGGSSTYGKQAIKAGYTGKNAVRDWLASFDKEKMSEFLFKDGDLAATLAMGKWISGLQNQVNENLAKAKQNIARQEYIKI
jgi:hypothetical protein